MSTSKSSAFENKVKFTFEDFAYDQKTYYGRLMHFVDVVNPKRFFLSDKRIKEAKEKTDQIKMRLEIAKNINSNVYVDKDEVQEIIENKRIVDSLIHPDTGEKIPHICRMSGFVLLNTPILFGMLMTQQTPLNIMFFQWLNQSYNAGLNYGNRNASSPYSNTDMLRGYCGAVVTSITIAMSLNKLFSGITARMTGSKKFLASAFFNMTASSLAGGSNVGLMRYKELENGIMVKDFTGTEHGKSKIVGKTALIQTIITRALISMMVMSGPAVIIMGLKSKNLMPKKKMGSVLVEGTLCAAALGVSLPIAIASFPQEGKISVDKLEPEFHNLKDIHGKPVTEFYFNKGL